MPTDASIACRPKPNASPCAYVDAVRDAERRRDRDLHEADVAGPQRDHRRDVHQDQHEPGRRQPDVDVERLHRRPHREHLAVQPKHWPRIATSARNGLAHDSEAVPAIVTIRRTRAHPVEARLAVVRARTQLRTGTAQTPTARRIQRLVYAQCGIFAARAPRR